MGAWVRHLAGIHAAKKVITSFIDKEMGQNDQAAIEKFVLSVSRAAKQGVAG